MGNISRSGSIMRTLYILFAVLVLSACQYTPPQTPSLWVGVENQDAQTAQDALPVEVTAVTEDTSISADVTPDTALPVEVGDTSEDSKQEGADADVAKDMTADATPDSVGPPSCGVCNDGNPCTEDICTTEGICVAMFNTAPCEDGSECTKQDTCTQGKCVGVTINCDDKDKCTLDTCDVNQGCMHLLTNVPCVDNNPCTVDETCLGNTCSSKPKNCDDGNECTEDACDLILGCSNKPTVKLKYCTSPDPTAYYACSAGTCAKWGNTFCPTMNGEIDTVTKQVAFWKDARATLVSEYNSCVQAGACSPLTGTTNPNPHYVHKIVEVSDANSTNVNLEKECTWGITNGNLTQGGSVCTDPLDEPVMVPTNSMAEHYCTWRGGRVPTWEDMKKVMGTMVSNGETFPSAQCSVVGTVTDVPSKMWTYLAKCGNTYMNAPSQQVVNTSMTSTVKMTMIALPKAWSLFGNTKVGDIGIHVKYLNWETNAQIYCVFDQQPTKECWP